MCSGRGRPETTCRQRTVSYTHLLRDVASRAASDHARSRARSDCRRRTRPVRACSRLQTGVGRLHSSRRGVRTPQRLPGRCARSTRVEFFLRPGSVDALADVRLGARRLPRRHVGRPRMARPYAGGVRLWISIGAAVRLSLIHILRAPTRERAASEPAASGKSIEENREWNIIRTSLSRASRCGGEVFRLCLV